MMDIKPFAESAEISEQIVRKLVEEYDSLTVIRAICELLKADMVEKIENREKWLTESCKKISEKNKPSFT